MLFISNLDLLSSVDCDSLLVYVPLATSVAVVYVLCSLSVICSDTSIHYHVLSAFCPYPVRPGMQKAVDTALEHLKTVKREVNSHEEVIQVATISANNDHATGSLIADAVRRVGKNGVITVKDGKTLDDELEVTEGMKFDRGFISPYFCNKGKRWCVLGLDVDMCVLLVVSGGGGEWWCSKGVFSSCVTFSLSYHSAPLAGCLCAVK